MVPSYTEVEAPLLLKSRAAYLLVSEYDPMEGPLLTAPLAKLRGAEELLAVVMGTTCQWTPQRHDVTLEEKTEEPHTQWHNRSGESRDGLTWAGELWLQVEDLTVM